MTARRDGGRLGRCPTACAAHDEEEREAEPPERPAPPPAAQPSHVAQVLAAQSGAGNAMVSRALVEQRAPARQVQGNWIGDIVNKAKKNAGMPYVADIGGEKVQVTDAKQEAEAALIIKTIQDEYGIEISTSKGVTAVKDHYDNAPESVRKKVKGATWLFEELQALERALAHFAPILGTQRLLSDRAGEEQEITSASKVDQSITTNKASRARSTTTRWASSSASPRTSRSSRPARPPTWTSRATSASSSRRRPCTRSRTGSRSTPRTTS